MYIECVCCVCSLILLEWCLPARRTSLWRISDHWKSKQYHFLLSDIPRSFGSILSHRWITWINFGGRNSLVSLIMPSRQQESCMLACGCGCLLYIALHNMNRSAFCQCSLVQASALFPSIKFLKFGSGAYPIL